MATTKVGICGWGQLPNTDKCWSGAASSFFTTKRKHLFHTTFNSSRLDPSLVCLGWIHCCAPLPPLHAIGHQALHRCHPTRSAQPPSRAGLTCRHPVLVGSIVVPRYPLSLPVDIKYFVVVAPHVLHNLHLKQS